MTEQYVNQRRALEALLEAYPKILVILATFQQRLEAIETKLEIEVPKESKLLLPGGTNEA